MALREVEALFRQLLGREECGEFREVLVFLSTMAEDLALATDGAPAAPQLAAAVLGFFPELEGVADIESKLDQLLGKLRRRHFLLNSKARVQVRGDRPPRRSARAAPPAPTARPPAAAAALATAADRSRTADPLAVDEEADAARVAALLELLPPDSPLQRCHLQYVFVVLARRCAEDATAMILDELVSPSEARRLENAERIRVNYEQWARDRRDAERLSRVSEAEVLRATVDKYALRPDSKREARPLVFVDESHKEKRTHYRYLNGQKVAFKSGKEKYVIEQAAPEWDGGSRGKVKTKGKRGPGWVQ